LDGQTVDLGRVGIPSDAGDTHVLTTLMRDRFVPVIACVGLDRDGRLLNVNADTFAGHLAARLGARRLVIAGTTRGVLDGAGATVAVLEPPALAQLIEERTATAGMIAKLRACEYALASGVADVVIVDGRDRAALEAAALDTAPPTATRLIPAGVKTCATTGGA
jgi:acetylglutamate kinase